MWFFKDRQQSGSSRNIWDSSLLATISWLAHYTLAMELSGPTLCLDQNLRGSAQLGFTTWVETQLDTKLGPNTGGEFEDSGRQYRGDLQSLGKKSQNKWIYKYCSCQFSVFVHFELSQNIFMFDQAEPDPVTRSRLYRQVLKYARKQWNVAPSPLHIIKSHTNTKINRKL